MSAKTSKIDTASSENWEQKKQYNVLKKQSGLPFLSTVCHLVSTKYTSIKKRHSYMKSMCTETEKRVKNFNEVAVSCVQPFLTTLEPQPVTVNCKDLDSMEEKLPVLCETTDQVVSDAKDLLMSSKVMGENYAVTNRITGVVDLTKEATQTSFANGHRKAFVQQQQDYDSYLVLLGTTMTKFWQCAYHHSWSNVKNASQCIGEALQTSYLLLKYCVISLFHTITQPLKTIYLILRISIENFPINFQDKMQQVSPTMEVFHASSSTLDSFQDLSRKILSQIGEKVTEEENCMNKLLEYVAYSTPLSWFVGLFNA